MKVNNHLVLEIPDVSKILNDDQKALWRTWIEALRSGKYKQGKGKLKSVKSAMTGDSKILEGQDLHCCIGVLGELLLSPLGATFHPDPYDIDAGDRLSCILSIKGTDKSRTFLPTEAQSFVGTTIRGVLKIYLHSEATRGSFDVDLAYLNDEGVPFEEIANIIEKALTGGYKYEPSNVENVALK